MTVRRRLCALATTVALTPALLVLTPPAASSAGNTGTHRAGAAESAQVVLDWERILMQTVYPATPIPSGVPLLGFTSVAMHDAVTKSMRRPHSSEAAAVARAAHDVLVHYFPASAATLAAHLDTSLAAVTDPEERARGELQGAAAAREMLASRVGDGYGDPDIHYTLSPAIGIWQPVPPATDMLVAWLGSLEPMVLRNPIRVDGPDRLRSRAYAVDYNQVKRLGGSPASGTQRSQRQTETAQFFNANSATMVGDALVRYLESGAEDLSLAETALLFARIHAAMTDSVIQAWQLKRDVGFWRPNEAIAGAGGDGNPRTAPQAGWTSLLAVPPYADYVSGHAALTAPAIEVIRRTLGERTRLELISANPLATDPQRTYARLRGVEWNAFHSRIWGGLHFRDAMVDGYRIGHLTARRVMAALH
ncbi:MAG: vanadium-dependent haloperoxidase, partial [Nocardioides sp.]